jgi:hypothetical protein
VKVTTRALFALKESSSVPFCKNWNPFDGCGIEISHSNVKSNCPLYMSEMPPLSEIY